MDGAFCYLAVGRERALLFDSCYGAASLSEEISRLTSKPFDVVLGHGHLDHAGGAFQFEEAWLREEDFEVCRKHTSEKARRRMYLDRLADSGIDMPPGFDPEAYAKAPQASLRKLEPGKIFDLGGLTMEVVDMGGHTAGSIGLLAREPRVLIDSDSACELTWVFLPDSLPLSRYADMLRRVGSMGFDRFLSGHLDVPRDAAAFAKFLRAALEATPERARPFAELSMFGGLVYGEEGAEVAFNPERL